ncbi:MAG TPA: PaaI family thioesterase [Ktedonobacteraceae bacterium]|jgi:uncharacterized protein (TIGR00369 family)|nr:PaaI family thioesterase [Ktedonobacteraceae bacterium]
MNQRTGLFWDILEGRTSSPPAALLLGGKVLEVDPEQGTLTVVFEARPEFLNPFGIIHGGFLAAMLDDTLGATLAATLGTDEFAPTIELQVSFIHAARVGPLQASGRVVHRGKFVAFLQGELRTLEGQLLATASATVLIQTIR